MNGFVKLPRWKAYLYTLLRRIRYYKWLNQSWVKLGIIGNETYLLNSMFKKYVEKGVMRKPKAYWYDQLIQSVLVENISIAEKEELELAMRLQWIKHINVKEITMEMKQLKSFGKEVGLKPLSIGKMKEEDLIIEIVKNINPQSDYSQEFVAWYDSLDDKYFDKAETEDIDGSTDNIIDVDIDANEIDDLKQALNEITKVADLREFLNDDEYAHYFSAVDGSKYRIAKTLKKAMIDALDALLTDEGESDKVSDIVVDDETKAILIETIQTIETEDELIEFISDEDVEAIFADALNIEDEIEVNDIKEQMLTLLGFEAEKKDKPMTLKEKLAAKAAKTSSKTTTSNADEMVIDFDTESFDLNEVYAETEQLGIPQLRKFAKQLEITVPAGSKKVDILEMVADRLTEMAEGGAGATESTSEEEVEITQSIINDAIEADDKEALIEMCNAMGIKISALQKRSTKIMGDKLLEVAPEDEPEKRDKPTKRQSLSSKLKSKSKSAPTSETRSIYQQIEEMVLAGEEESTIVNTVKPLYKALGKTLIHCRKSVKQMVEVVKADNDIS